MASPSTPNILTRVGQGFDVHALVEGRPLIIGGVRIPFERGLDGNSDADVLLHAITDALLGAAGLGDMGRYFPENDPRFKDADSRELLRTALGRVHNHGWRVVNVDATIIAEAPKMSPHVRKMVEYIADDCEVSMDAVNIKSKTTDHLGFIGRGEGIAVMTVVMLQKDAYVSEM